MKDYKNPEDLLGKNGISAELKKRLLERAMEAEMEDHLGYPKNGKSPKGSDNCRNGHSRKKVIFQYRSDPEWCDMNCHVLSYNISYVAL